MRILQVANTLAVTDGGPARAAFELHLALNRLPGTQGDLIWINGELADSVAAESPFKAGRAPRRLGMRTDAAAHSISKFAFGQLITDADIVVINGYYLAWAPGVARACRQAGTPYVFIPRGVFTRYQVKASRLKKAMFELVSGRRMRRGALGFVTGSSVEAEELVKHFPGATVAVGGMGTALPPAPTAVPTAYHEPLRLVSVSRVASKKRIDLMIDCIAALEARGVDAALAIFGTGNEVLIDRLRHQAEILGVSARVRFCGHVGGAAKTAAYRSGDVFLLPSDDENFGVGLAEALAHGLPAFVSDKVASAAAMSNDSGAVITAPTGESLADALVQFVTRVPRASAFAAATADAAAHFSWDAAAARTVVALRELGLVQD